MNTEYDHQDIRMKNVNSTSVGGYDIGCHHKDIIIMQD